VEKTTMHICLVVGSMDGEALELELGLGEWLVGASEVRRVSVGIVCAYTHFLFLCLFSSRSGSE
jgi:hypothetical protein